MRAANDPRFLEPDGDQKQDQKPQPQSKEVSPDDGKEPSTDVPDLQDSGDSGPAMAEDTPDPGQDDGALAEPFGGS